MPEIAATVEDTACINSPDSTAVVASALAVSEPINITCPELLIIPDPTICGQSTGLIDLTVTPADNYTYLWSNNATTEDISNLPAGLYIVTVTDANGCSATASATVTVYWSGFSLFGITIDPDAGQNNGAIDLIVSPAGTYTYSWSNGATTEDLSNLGEGAYTVTVTTPAGCTEIATFFLENVCDLFTTYTINPTNYCPGQQVTLTLNPTGGTQPYTYLWNNGATTQSITFTATNVISTDGAVTDANGCLAQVFIHIKSSIWQVFIVPSPATCGQDDGHVELTVPGSGNMTFNWSNGSTNEDLFDVAPGPYTVTITGEDGCTTTASTTVTSINTNLSIAGLTTPNSGCGAPNGSIDINVDPAGSYTYNWSNGSTDVDLFNIPGGTYTVTVSAGSNCSATASFVVLNNSSPPVPSTIVTANTCGQNNGAINLTVNPADNYTFNWSNGASTEDLADLSGGNYSVTITSPGGCTAVTNATVANSNSNPTVTGATTANNSCLTPNGAIDISVSPTGSYTFAWSNGASTEDLSDLAAATYTVTVSVGGCTTTASFAVTTNLQMPSPSIVPTAATCGQENGAANLSVSPAGTYTYDWSNGASSEDLNNIAAGTYTVTVTGSNGCTATQSTNIANNSASPTVTGAITANTSCITPNGQVDITPSPVGAYTFSWSNGSAAEDQTDLAAGTYTVTVTLSGTCTASASFAVTTNLQLPNPVAATTAATCGQENGAVNLSVTPVDAYTYEWSNGANSEDLTNVAAGAYLVTVTGSNGCTNTQSTTVANTTTNPTVTGSVTVNSSCITPNGAIDITANPGGNYIFDWSNGSAEEDQTGLAAGNYTVTVTLGGICTASASFAITTNLQLPNPSVTSTAATCGQPNGAANLTVTPNGAYTYEWSNADITEDLQNVAAGLYTVTVTGANGCTKTQSVTIANTNSNPSIAGNVSANTGCQQFDGAIDISASPAGVYTYAWSNGSSAEDQSALDAGTYTVTVTLGGICTASASFAVASNQQLPVTGIAATAATCGQPNGAANLSVTPAGTYTYNWSNSASTEDLNNVAAGTYTVTVTGANGCSSTQSVVITNTDTNPVVTGTITENTSCQQLNGAIDITASPVATYTYLWSNGSAAEDQTALPAGTYTVTVTQTGTCTASASFVVTTSLQLPEPAVLATSATCGQSNGAANLSVTPAGTYTYNWSNSASTEDLNNVAAGTYTVTVTGANGCSSTQSVVITNTDTNPVVTGTITENTSCQPLNGAIDITASPAAGYTYAWSNGSAAEDQTALPAGSYTVTVTQTGTCTASASFVVTTSLQLPEPAILATSATCGQPNGAANLSVTPAGTYTYNWSNSASTEDLNNVAAGTYTVTVTGANGCSSTQSIVIANTDTNPIVTGTITENTSCQPLNGAIDITASPAAGYTYVWSNGSATEDQTALPAGSYTVTVTQTGTCTASASFVVTTSLQLPEPAVLATSATCGQPNGAANLSVTPAGTYTYNWSNSASTEDLNNVAAGTYTVTITGSNGCSNTQSVVISNTDTNPVVTGTITENTSCQSLNGAIDITASPAAGYTYAWSNGSAAEDQTALPAGTYTVTVTQTGTCTASASFVVTTSLQLPEPAVLATSATCGQPNGAANLSVTPAGTYTFNWSNSASTEDLNNVAAGTYTVTVTGANGCSSTIVAAISDNVVIPDISGTVVANTTCDAPTGSVNLLVLPAGTSYTYNWSNGSSDQNLTGLTAGAYTVTVSSGGSCVNTAAFTVTDNSFAPILSAGVLPADCAASNGAISLAVAPVLGNQFIWSNGAVTQNLQQLLAGTYSVTCTGANGCTASTTVIVPNNDIVFNLAASAQNVSSCITANGAVDLQVMPAGVYSYLWSNGATTEDLQNLPEGTYTVTVSDGSGCADFMSITVPGPTIAPVVLLGPSSVCAGDVATLFTTGTFAQYLWSNGQTTASITTTQAGSYTVTATDANGCTTTASQDLGNFSLPTPVVTGPSAICSGDATFTVGGGNFTQITWSTGATTASITVSQGGLYTVMVSDVNGCAAMATQSLSVGNGLLPDVTASAPSCNAAAMLDVSAGFVSYLWSNGATGQHISVSTAGSYTVTVSDASGCTGTAIATVVIPTPPPVHNIVLEVCPGGSAAYQGVTIPVGSTQAFVFNAANGCDSVVSVKVMPLPAVNFTLATTKTCWNAATGSIALNDLSGAAPYQFSLDGGEFQNQPIFQDLGGGEHQLQVEDANGCLLERTIPVPTTTPTQLLVENDTLSCENSMVRLQPKVVSDHPADITWAWPDGSNKPWYQVEAAGTYTVHIDDGCEEQEASMEVVWASERLETDFFYIPNVFSPNDDGLNDVFQVYPDPNIDIISFEFRVFDRWGDELFVTKELDGAWNGWYHEVDMQPAVYVWYVGAKVLVCDGRVLEVFRKGDVTIVR